MDAFSRILGEDFERIRHATDWAELCGKTIVVTGAAGFLAAYAVEFLLDLPDPPYVIGLVRDLDRAWRRFARYADCRHLNLRQADVVDMPPITERVDLILHAASQAAPKYYGVDPVGTLAANVFGTQRYLELARATGALFVFFSTGDVYGAVQRDRIRESDYGYIDPIDVRSCYGESKRMAENMCVSWQRQYGVRSRIMRIFHTYGPGMRADDGRVFADFVQDIVYQRDIVMKSSGTAIRAFCYLSDTLSGFLTAIAHGDDAQPYNVGNEDCANSVSELATLLLGLFPERSSRVAFNTRDAGANYLESPLNRVIPDTSKLRALGWKPVVGLADGFKRTIESYLP